MGSCVQWVQSFSRVGRVTSRDLLENNSGLYTSQFVKRGDLTLSSLSSKTAIAMKKTKEQEETLEVMDMFIT